MSRFDRLYLTTDAGRTWTRRHAPPVSAIAFADKRVGYAFARLSYDIDGATWVTRDGARTWQRMPGRATAALAVGGPWTYRVDFHGDGCPGPCDLRIQRSPTGSTRWRTVEVPPYTGDGASISASDRVAIVTLPGNPAGGEPDAHALYVVSTDSGATWGWRPNNDPCGGSRQQEWDTTDVTVNGTTIVALCAERLTQHDAIVVSHDFGRTFIPRRSTASRNDELIALSGPRILTATAYSGEGRVHYAIDVSEDDGLTWTRVEDDTGPANEYYFDTARLQCVSAGCVYLADPRGLLVSTDHGQTWVRRAVPQG